MKNTKKKKSELGWSFIVLLLAFSLSVIFGIASEFALDEASVWIAALIIVIFIAIAIISDMVGVAIASAEIEPFHAMAAKKVRGAKQAIKLVNNASKVASIASDVIGDVCGILSGAAAASIAIMIDTGSTFYNILIATACSALVASLTIFGKSIFKKYAINNAESIILILGKVMSIFSKNTDKSVKKSKKDKNNVQENIETEDKKDYDNRQ